MPTNSPNSQTSTNWPDAAAYAMSVKQEVLRQPKRSQAEATEQYHKLKRQSLREPAPEASGKPADSE